MAGLRASSSAAFVALAMQAFPAYAQVQSAQAPEEVIVTGSRLILDGSKAPTPVTVASVEQLNDLRPGTLQDALRDLPVLQYSLSPQTQNRLSSGIGTNGASFLDLRNLGAGRTLILVDGRRIVPSGAAGTVDVSILPESLVQRVEVVTGGASSAYGSDAVAGVVNYVLDKRFTGFKGEVSGGISEEGDNENYTISLASGLPFAGGRGHVIASAEYYNNDGVPNGFDRHWLARQRATILNPAVTTSNPASPSNPNRITFDDVQNRQYTYGGLINTGPLAGTQFLAGGEVAPFVPGTLVSPRSQAQVGGGGPDPDPNVAASVTGELERAAAFVHGIYDLTDNFNIFAEYAWADVHSARLPAPNVLSGTSAVTIFQDNAYLPAEIRSQMQGLGLDSFALNRLFQDLGDGPVEIVADNDTNRGAVGFEGTLAGRWGIGGSYSYGRAVVDNAVINNLNYVNLYNAADAVMSPATGEIVCNSTLAFPTNGCVPINLFGEGSPSPAARQYVSGESAYHSVAQQHFVELSIKGDLFTLPAGPVGVAAGVSYREESVEQTSDEISQQYKNGIGLGFRGWPSSLQNQLGGWFWADFQPLEGSFNVKEVFAETTVPLLKDLPFANSLELNGAVRYADYSLNAGGVTTWKVGAVYAPTAEIRVRAALSRDIRNASILELFQRGQQASGNAIDPFNGGVTVFYNPVTIGNPNLKPEKADTLTLGVVYRPDWAESLLLSADYYDIDVRDYITTLGGQNIVNLCFAGNQSLCPLVQFDPVTGLLSGVINPTLNAARFKTSGLDLEASYTLPLERLNSAWDGELFVRLMGTAVFEFASQTTGGALIDLVGNSTGSPDYTALLSLTYSRGPLRMSLATKYIPDLHSPQLVPGVNPSPADEDANMVDGRVYAQLALSYDVTDRYELFANVNNLFDEDPPYSPAFGPFAITTNPSLFDRIGRQYTLGMRFRW